MSSDRRIVVTGATGFLGGHIARRLAQAGAQVLGTGRRSDRGERLRTDGVQFLAGDLADPEFSKDLVRGAHQVIHAAALTSPWGRSADFERANLTATRTVVEACLANRVQRLVHISTPSIYMEARDRLEVAEDEPLPAHPINEYARTKRAAEEIVLEASRRGLAAIILRPQGIIGEGDEAIFPRIIRLAREGRVPRFSNANPWIDLTYVDNVVDAVLLASSADSKACGRAYNITNGEPVRIYDVIREVVTPLGLQYREPSVPLALALRAADFSEFLHRHLFVTREPKLTRYAVCMLAFGRTLSIERAKRDLGYHPRVPLREGLARYLRWLQERGQL